MGTKWRAPSPSLSWTDILSHMTAVEETHECWCSIRLTSGGSRGSAGLRIIASAILPLVGGSTEGLVVVEQPFPDRTHQDLFGAMLEVLVSLDYEVGARYRQHEIFREAERTNPPPK